MTPFYEYIYILQGRSSLDVFESHEDTGLDNQFGSINYQNMVYRFGLKDVPALTDESFITSRNDYVIKIDFQLAKIHYPDGTKKDIISTWPALNNELLKTTEFGRYINASEKAAKESFNLSEIAGKNKLEQLEYIVNQVKSQYSWNNTNSKYAGKSVKEFLKEKTGNSAEINLFLLGFLRAAGIEANAVIISTRSNGKISSDYPFMHFYNYVIVLVNIDGKHILADATEPMCPFNKIPPRCVNEIGLIVKKDGQDFVKLSNSDKSFLDKSITIQYTPGLDSLKASVNTTYSNYESFDFKKEYQDDLEKIKSSIVKKGYLNVDSLKTKNYSDSKKNYKVSYCTSIALEYLENKTYISPFLNEAITENPLKQLTRQYPLDFIYPYGRTFKSIITIPKGYKIQFMPTALNINNNLVTVSYQISEIEENKLIVTGAYVFNNGLYTAEEYPKIRYYFNEIIKKFNEKIVLEKVAL